MLQDSLERLHSLNLPAHTPLSGHGGADVARVGSTLASAVLLRGHEAVVLHEEHACVQKLPRIAACSFIYHVKI